MIITLTGKKGAGKSVVAEELKKQLGYEVYSIGSAKRELAQEMGLSITEFDELSKKDPEKYHRQFDEQTKKAGERDNLIIDSNIGFFFIPHSFKVFFTADDQVRGTRVFDQKRASEETFTTWQQALASMDNRIKLFREEAIKLYGPDCDPLDESNFDLVVDTSDMSIKEVADYIIAQAKQRGFQL